jgi:hypothetical protein
MHVDVWIGMFVGVVLLVFDVLSAEKTIKEKKIVLESRSKAQNLGKIIVFCLWHEYFEIYSKQL